MEVSAVWYADTTFDNLMPFLQAVIQTPLWKIVKEKKHDKIVLVTDWSVKRWRKNET